MSTGGSRAIRSTAAGCLPDRPSQLLLDTALTGADRAVPAFYAWLGMVDLRDDLGWPVVRLFPLVYHNLQSIGVQDPLLGTFKGVYRRSWYESQQLIHRGGAAVTALRDHGIDLRLLDGAAIAVSSYEPASLRGLTDVRVLLDPGEVASAVEVLRQRAWTCAGDAHRDDLHFADYLRLRGPDDAELRLYWRLIRGGSPVTRQQLTQLRGPVVEWQGLEIPLLEPTSQLARIILEGLRPESPGHLQWVVDAVLLLRTPGITVDWPRLQTMASVSRLTGRLALGCRYLADRFGADIPGPVLADLLRHRPSLSERLAYWADRTQGPEAPDWGVPRRDRLSTEWLRYFGRYRRLGSPARAAGEFSHFLRYWWRLDGRRELVPGFRRISQSRRTTTPAAPRPH